MDSARRTVTPEGSTLGFAGGRETCQEGGDDPVHGVRLGDHLPGSGAGDNIGDKRIDAPEGARLIPLSGKRGAGQFAIVDAADYDLVAGISWHLQQRKRGRGYAAGVHNGRPTYMHRLIAGALPGEQVDHADRDRLNNRRINLRRCTRSQNAANMIARSRWGFKGVCKARNHFTARIVAGGNNIYLGLFSTPEDAARAYDTAAKQFHGPFARLNFPDESAVSHATDNARGEKPCRQTTQTTSDPKEVNP